jgi:hypothetical protein
MGTPGQDSRRLCRMRSLALAAPGKPATDRSGSLASSSQTTRTAVGLLDPPGSTRCDLAEHELTSEVSSAPTGAHAASCFFDALVGLRSQLGSPARQPLPRAAGITAKNPGRGDIRDVVAPICAVQGSQLQPRPRSSQLGPLPRVQAPETAIESHGDGRAIAEAEWI